MSDHRCHRELEPGEVCGCGYRRPFPKTNEAPETRVRSFRGPADSIESFNENLWVGCRIIGLDPKTKHAPFVFFDWVLSEIIANPDSFAGAYTRRRSDAA